ncbi:MAG: 2-amino-4-hydroxy-6-hydroxymethyldihydropteridine diphosphokinase [Flavobacteriaceae bacterium]|nr:2-amino-4-hydroxy-6-hydroxymethyldihydropteridine diphosphokinase [Flavobacteriaceae bacterium]
MSKSNVILLLGSDLGNKASNLNQARQYIAQEFGGIHKFGNITETQPVEFTSDTTFLNQIIAIQTALSPMMVLKKVKEIEMVMGRVYSQPLAGEKYVSRKIDIDILMFESIIFKSEILVIPHNQIFKREFVKDMLQAFFQESSIVK